MNRRDFLQFLPIVAVGSVAMAHVQPKVGRIDARTDPRAVLMTVMDMDRFERIHGVIWVDDRSGEYEIYITDEEGEFQVDEDGFVTEVLRASRMEIDLDQMLIRIWP